MREVVVVGSEQFPYYIEADRQFKSEANNMYRWYSKVNGVVGSLLFSVQETKKSGLVKVLWNTEINLDDRLEMRETLSLNKILSRYANSIVGGDKKSVDELILGISELQTTVLGLCIGRMRAGKKLTDTGSILSVVNVHSEVSSYWLSEREVAPLKLENKVSTMDYSNLAHRMYETDMPTGFLSVGFVADNVIHLCFYI